MTEDPMEQKTNPPTCFLRLPEVQKRTGLSRSTIYVRLAEGRFPRPVALGTRAVGWVEAEVEAWIRERIAESRPDGAARAEGANKAVPETPRARRRPSDARSVR